MHRTPLYGRSYRHRPNGLEAPKTTHPGQQNTGNPSIRACPNRRAWETAETMPVESRTSNRLGALVIAPIDGGGRGSESAALRGGLLLSVYGRLRPLLERLAIPDHAFAGVVREFKILGEFQRIGRASIFAQAAEHAATKVVGEGRELFAASFFIAAFSRVTTPVSRLCKAISAAIERPRIR